MLWFFMKQVQRDFLPFTSFYRKLTLQCSPHVNNGNKLSVSSQKLCLCTSTLKKANTLWMTCNSSWIAYFINLTQIVDTEHICKKFTNNIFFICCSTISLCNLKCFSCLNFTTSGNQIIHPDHLTMTCTQ